MISSDSLSQEPEFLIAALGTLPCGIFILDHSLKIIWINRRLEEIFPNASWLGKRLGDLLQDGEEAFDILAAGTEGDGTVRKWILPQKRLRGQDVYLEVTVSTLEHSAETPQAAAYVGKVEDISERIGVEERLQEEASRRKILVEQSPDGIVVIDAKGNVFEANKGFADMLGYSLEEVHQLKIWDWDARYSREEIQAMLGAANEGGHNVQTLYRRRDGTILNVEMSTNGTTFKGLKLIFCVCRDITERCRKENEQDLLIQQLQKAAAEIEALPEMLALCAFCKNVRNEQGMWEPVEAFLSEQLQLMVSHGICPSCVTKHYSSIRL